MLQEYVGAARIISSIKQKSKRNSNFVILVQYYLLSLALLNPLISNKRESIGI